MSLNIYGQTLNSRLLIGSALYPSPEIMQQAILASGSQVVTLSLKRQNPLARSGEKIWRYIQETVAQNQGFLLPNTAGCKSAKEAITLAKMSRELFQTDWIKLEVIGDDYNLQPDPIELLIATEQLLADGFKILPYCTDDLVICQRLYALGCKVIMPWASPIGTGKWQKLSLVQFQQENQPTLLARCLNAKPPTPARQHWIRHFGINRNIVNEIRSFCNEQSYI